MKKIIALSVVALIAFACAAALVGCGNSESKAKANLSNDVQQVTSSMTELVDPNTYQSVDSFKTVWNKITTQYNKLIADAKSVKSVQVKNLTAGYDKLKKSIGNITSSQSLQTKISGILLAGQQFLAALSQLNTAVTPSK
ncbi:MAG TPA: hypothetical protein VIK22_02875 [Candidatus Anoxymicrobiaceae bacterium]